MHHSFLSPCLEEWVVAAGGRCFTLAQAKLDLQKQVRCAMCKKWVHIDGYDSHYASHQIWLG